MQDWLAHRAQISPHKTALIYRDQAWTYAALNQRVAAMCGYLVDAGVEPGDRVAVLMPNRPETIMAIHALARLGAVMVPLNVRLHADEVAWQIEQSGCRAVIAESNILREKPIQGFGGTVILVEDIDWETGGTDDWLARPLDLDSVQGIIYTSGTTGQPKGAMLTFANHLWNANASAYRLGTLPDDRWLLCMPLYHVGGLAIILRCCLYGTGIMLHDGFDAAAVSDALDLDRITLVSLVPTMLHRLLEQRGDRPFAASLRHILLGGAAASGPLLERSAALGLPVSLTYGLTEAASQVATATPEEVRKKPGSAGKPLMFTRVRVLGEDGCELPPGEIGEIVVQGPQVMRGYFEHPEATAAALRESWLHTGDLGTQDEDGDLWIVQRRTDLIVSGGENVYPSEVEAVLEAHPDIAEACVVGLPDAEWSQRVAAMIVRRNASLSEESITAYCREHLAGYKLPRTIVFGGVLPRTPSGKVQREKVARRIEEQIFTGSLGRNRR